MKEHTSRYLICCCCGSYAGHYKQHWNRDTGYGICKDCITSQSKKETPETIASYYGKAGINYEPSKGE